MRKPVFPDNIAAAKDGRSLRPYLLLNENVGGEILHSLSGAFCPLLLPGYGALPFPVCSHPDMLIFRKGKTLVTFAGYYEKNRSLFDSLEGYEIITAPEKVGREYPDDILLNALSLADTLYCKAESISSTLSGMFSWVWNVKQGYTACSVCKVSDDAIITADKGIARAVEKNGVKVLLIRPGHVALEGYDTGFIGGASFTYGERVYFFGDIKSHPDGGAISDFIEENKKECVSLSRGTLHDYGGGMVL